MKAEDRRSIRIVTCAVPVVALGEAGTLVRVVHAPGWIATATIDAPGARGGTLTVKLNDVRFEYETDGVALGAALTGPLSAADDVAPYPGGSINAR